MLAAFRTDDPRWRSVGRWRSARSPKAACRVRRGGVRLAWVGRLWGGCPEGGDPPGAGRSEGKRIVEAGAEEVQLGDGVGRRVRVRIGVLAGEPLLHGRSVARLHLHEQFIPTIVEGIGVRLCGRRPTLHDLRGGHLLLEILNRRGSFTSVEDLQRKLSAFIDVSNATVAKPFRWT